MLLTSVSEAGVSMVPVGEKQFHQRLPSCAELKACGCWIRVLNLLLLLLRVEAEGSGSI